MEPARTTRLDVVTARWLVGTEGRAAIGRAVELLDEGRGPLAVGSELRDGGIGPSRAAAVMDAATARRGHPELGPETVLTGAAAEQASHPAVSAWRARRYDAEPCVADLCAGIGGDAAALAATGQRLVVAVEADAAVATLLRQNLRVRTGSAMVVQGDARQPPLPRGTTFFADPSRRPGGQRVRRLGATVPPVPALIAAMTGPAGAAGGVAASPALALDDPDLPADVELAFVQVDGRLLEATLWLGDLRRTGTLATAVSVVAGKVHERHREGPPVELPVRPAAGILLEPAPAAVRARLHTALGEEVGAWRLASSRALLCAAEDPGPSPWWTRWRIEAVLPPRPRKVRAWLRTVEDQPLSISSHGLSGDVERWFERLGSPSRGPRGRRLHLVRTDDGAIAIAARPLADAQARERSLGPAADGGRVEPWPR